jgi:hypothetical protein
LRIPWASSLSGTISLDDKNGIFMWVSPSYCLHSGEALGTNRIKAYTILLVNEVLS